MQRFNTIAIGLLTAVLASGCVIVTDDAEGDWDGDRSGWKQEQEDNRDYIADLRIGTSLDVIRADLGRPEFSEGWTDDAGREVVVLRYRTHHRHSDGETTRDETTPLYFVGGRLSGWGDSVTLEQPVAHED